MSSFDKRTFALSYLCPVLQFWLLSLRGLLFTGKETQQGWIFGRGKLGEEMEGVGVENGDRDGLCEGRIYFN